MATEDVKHQVRTFGEPKKEDSDLGPLKHLPGVWKSAGLGWNMIALPFAGENSPAHYRLLMNQYNETLTFTLVGKAIPNRGIHIGANGSVSETDQFLVSLDYRQEISQIAAADFPESGLAGDPNLPIHHEAGLWLNMTNLATDGLDIARLSTIPHGDSVLALGQSSSSKGVSTIPAVDGLPVGVVQDLTAPYLAPYKHFHDNPFKGVVTAPGFPGFDPVSPQKLLELANEGVDVIKTTVLPVDSTVPTGGIDNIPFVVKQANASAMKSTFWIQELSEKDTNGDHKLRLQYLQVVLLDFFPRRDGLPGRIQWPHVSINTLEKDVVASAAVYK